LSLAKRLILILSGVTLTFLLLWVPFSAYEIPKDKGNPVFLGYGPVWSKPERPLRFVAYDKQREAYDKAYSDYQLYRSSHPALADEPNNLGFRPDPRFTVIAPGHKQKELSNDPWHLQDGIVTSPSNTPIEPTKPTEPEGYISAYVFRTASVDVIRVLLEIGGLTGLFLALWGFFSARAI
jgi:hypothetical protein